jgi:hypothetical protein
LFSVHFVDIFKNIRAISRNVKREFMLTSERKALILDRIRKEGRLVAKSFAGELGLSEDTVRRDLREMAGDGLLTRVHAARCRCSRTCRIFPPAAALHRATNSGLAPGPLR